MGKGKEEKTVNFMGMSTVALLFSALCIAASIWVWVSQGGSKFGVDFLGGHELLVRVESEGVQAGKLRKTLDGAGVENATVQAFESGEPEFSIRLGGTADETQSDSVVASVREALEAQFGKDAVQIIRSDFIGPTIGKELQRDAVIAVTVGLIAILAYIAYRFEMAFAIGAVAAVFHDVIVCVGAYLMSGRTLSMGSLAAALTILGYSVNDTIVVFDRVREEILKRGDDNLLGVINYSITQTLSRTIITSLLTLFSALALLLYGGGAISDLSFFLVVGVIAGTYSTIFIASPLALWWARRGSGREIEAGSSKEAA